MDEFENADGFQIDEIDDDDLSGGLDEPEVSIEDEISKINVVEEIERIVLENKCDYISATVELARKLDWDVSWLAPYISGPIKTRLQVEGEELGLLKRNSKPAALFE